MVRIVLDVEDIKEKLAQALGLTGIDGVERMQRKTPVATGHLRDNIAWDVEKRDKAVNLTFSFPFYSKYVEWGTPPHFPPVSAIRDWCIAKGIPEQYAFPIARAIASHGTRPQPFIRPYINNRFIKDLKKNLKEVFK